MSTTTREMVYGIYFAESQGGFNGPKGERQAGCVIAENQAQKEIIDNLVASDFLNQYMEYKVVDYGISIHINYKSGSPALILNYEEDL